MLFVRLTSSCAAGLARAPAICYHQCHTSICCHFSLSLSLCAPSVKACSYTSISSFPTLVTLRGRPSFSVASTSTPLSTHGRRCLPHHLCVCMSALSLCVKLFLSFSPWHTHSKPTKGLKFVVFSPSVLFSPWLEFFFFLSKFPQFRSSTRLLSEHHTAPCTRFLSLLSSLSLSRMHFLYPERGLVSSVRSSKSITNERELRSSKSIKNERELRSSKSIKNEKERAVGALAARDGAWGTGTPRDA